MLHQQQISRGLADLALAIDFAVLGGQLIVSVREVLRRPMPRSLQELGEDPTIEQRYDLGRESGW